MRQLQPANSRSVLLLLAATLSCSLVALSEYKRGDTLPLSQITFCEGRAGCPRLWPPCWQRGQLEEVPSLLLLLILVLAALLRYGLLVPLGGLLRRRLLPLPPFQVHGPHVIIVIQQVLQLLLNIPLLPLGRICPNGSSSTRSDS